MRRQATLGLLAALTIAAAAPALAQEIPPGQSCGGLFCDLGIFGHKVPLGPHGEAPTPEQIAVAVDRADAADPHRLPCRDFLCRAFGQKDAEAVPPPPSVAVAAPVAPEPATRKAVRKHHAAKVASRTAAPAEPAPEPTPAK